MKNPHLGQIVHNFGFTATVIGFHKITGDPVLQDINDGNKWIAEAAKCEPAGETMLKHKHGLICFG